MYIYIYIYENEKTLFDKYYNSIILNDPILLHINSLSKMCK